VDEKTNNTYTHTLYTRRSHQKCNQDF